VDNDFRAVFKGPGTGVLIGITDLLPGDAFSAEHIYTVKLSRG